MRRALVVGGAGFLGSSLVDRLLAGDWYVEVVDDLSTGSLERLADARAQGSRQLRIHRHDVADSSTPDLVVRAEPEVVFFLADRSGDADPGDVVHTMNVGLVQTIEGARQLSPPPKIVLALAAADVHQGTGDGTARREDQMTDPVDHRGVAAQFALSSLRTHRAGSRVEFTALLFSEVYGTGAPATLALTHLLAEAAREPSTGAEVAPSQPITAIHLDDAVDALVRAADRADGLVVNVGPEAVITAADVVGVLEGLGRSVTLAGSDLDPALALDIGRAAIHLGWRPFTDLTAGIRDVLSSGG